jgi:hypothetical protein
MASGREILQSAILAGGLSISGNAVAEDEPNPPKQEQQESFKPVDVIAPAPKETLKFPMPKSIWTESSYNSNGNDADSHMEGLWFKDENYLIRTRHFRTEGESTFQAGARIKVPLGASTTELSVFGERSGKTESGIGVGLETNIDKTAILGGTAEWKHGENDNEQLLDIYAGLDLWGAAIRAGLGAKNGNLIGHGMVGLELSDIAYIGVGGIHEEVPGDRDSRELNGMFSLVTPGKEFGARVTAATGFDRTARVKVLLALYPNFGPFCAKPALHVANFGYNEPRLIPDITNVILPYDWERGKVVLVVKFNKDRSEHKLHIMGSYSTDELVGDLRLHAGLTYGRLFADRNRDSITVNGGLRGYGFFLNGTATVRDGDKPSVGTYAALDVPVLIDRIRGVDDE